jgi:hypothetical protein
MKIGEVKRILKRIDDALRLLHAPQRPTPEEQSKFSLEHGEKPGENSN